jgi:hypothetical protein
MQQIGIFTKIITSGQTGADQGALDAALLLGHPCGGWCPKGRKSEAGRIPDRYPMQEHPSASYPARTEANVRDADGTLVFLHGQPTRGTALTIRLTRKHAKPLFIVDLKQADEEAMAERIFAWGVENQIGVLNVAGSRESKHPGIGGIVQAVIERVIELAGTQCRA